MKRLPEDQEQIISLETELKQKEQELNDAYAEAGKAMLEMAERESQKINSLVDEIIILRRTLKLLDEERRTKYESVKSAGTKQ